MAKKKMKPLQLFKDYHLSTLKRKKKRKNIYIYGTGANPEAPPFGTHGFLIYEILFFLHSTEMLALSLPCPTLPSPAHTALDPSLNIIVTFACMLENFHFWYEKEELPAQYITNTFN